MRRLSVLLTLIAAAFCAQAAPPTEASVLQLLEVTKAEAMLEQGYSQIEQMVKLGIDQGVAGRPLNDEQKRAIAIAPARIADLMRKELSWDKLRPMYVAIYREAFDQSDIDGLIEFYQSPVGQNLIAKMPAVMQRSMAVTQMQLQSILPKLKQAVEQTLRDAKLPPGA